MKLRTTLFTTGILAAALVLFSCQGNPSNANNSENTEDTMTAEQETTAEPEQQLASPRKQAEGTIDGVNVVVDYGSPAVKDRKIWGGLEEYGAVWRAGANETTSVEFSEDVMIGDTKVPAGKYGIYMIPKENEDWVFILNTDWSREEHNAWGAYNYKQENDVLRMEVKPEMVDENQERLMYEVNDDAIAFAWEKARLEIPVSKAG